MADVISVIIVDVAVAGIGTWEVTTALRSCEGGFGRGGYYSRNFLRFFYLLVLVLNFLFVTDIAIFVIVVDVVDRNGTTAFVFRLFRHC